MDSSLLVTVTLAVLQAAPLAGGSTGTPTDEDAALAVLRAPAAPAAPGSSSRAKVQSKVVTFVTEDDLTITADYYEPRKKNTRAPSAILVHDAGADRSQMTLFAERLNKQGLAVLVPDVRGHGDSATEDQSWAKLDEKARERLWSFAPRDLEAAALWLEKRTEVHGSNLTVVGLRAGCALAVYHAGRHASVQAVVLIEPAAEPVLGFDLRREIGGLAGLTTKVFTPREKQDEAEIIKLDATKANDGLEFVEIDLTKSKGPELVNDRRIAADVAKWVEDRAFPKRGRR